MSELRIFEAPPFDAREALRYAGAGGDTCKGSIELCMSAFKEAEPVLNYRVCFCELKFTTADEICDFGVFKVSSQKLARALLGSDKVILFLATVGHGIDKLIRKYAKLSPARAVMLGAVGSERVEALSDEFCRAVANENGMTPGKRFSPGYGDLPLSLQREIFEVLRPELSLGTYLSDSCFMSPSKTVTAFLGLKNT